MFNNADEWVLKFSESRLTNLDAQGRVVPIPAIEPDVTFTRKTIGVFVTSNSASPRWLRAGELLQVLFVGFGEGYAQGALRTAILNRYMIHRFDGIPGVGADMRYLISFAPKQWLRDVTIKVWEYIGTNDGITNEDLEESIRRTHNRVQSESATIRSILRRIDANTQD